MPDFGAAFDTLTDTDTAVKAAVAGGGFLAPTVTTNLLSNQVGLDLPPEVHGLVVFALIEAMSGSVPMARSAEAGALAYTTNQAASRFGVRSTITNLGGGN